MDKQWYARVEEKINTIHKKIVEERDEEIQRISKLETGHTTLWWLLSVTLLGIAAVIGKMLGLA